MKKVVDMMRGKEIEGERSVGETMREEKMSSPKKPCIKMNTSHIQNWGTQPDRNTTRLCRREKKEINM